MRIVGVVALLVAALLLPGCIGPGVWVSVGGPREFDAAFDASTISASIRSSIASDFPDYRIIDGSVDEQDALLTLSSTVTTFTLDVDYRNPKAYGEGPGSYYYGVGDAGDLDMRDTASPQVSSLIAYFAKRYPAGDYVFQGTRQENPESDGTTYMVGVYRMHIAGTPAPVGTDAPREQSWHYDPIAKAWSSK